MVYHGHPVFLWTTTDFTQGFHTKSKKKLTLSFNFMLHYADDVIPRLLFVYRIVPTELEIKNAKIQLVLLYSLIYA